MPLEIRELVIKATIDQNRPNNSNINIEENLNKMKAEIMSELSSKVKNLINFNEKIIHISIVLYFVFTIYECAAHFV